jgi:hypothetical protein
MALERKLHTRGLSLTEGRNCASTAAWMRSSDAWCHPTPLAELVLTAHPMQRRVEADLRVRLTPLGAHIVSHQAAPTTDQAVRLAVEDVERDLERKHAEQRGEPSYGVPSRRPWRWRTPRRPETGA